jgi:glycogen(starch) synthase
MKLCFQTKTWGEGAGWFAQELARGMAEAGAEVIYVAPPAIPEEREPHHQNLRRVVTPRERQSGSRLLRVLSSARRVIGGYWACLRARGATASYLFSIPDPLPFFIPLQVLLRLSGARLFFVVHDAKPHSWSGGFAPSPLAYFGHWLSYRLATDLVATTSDCRDDLVATFGAEPSRVSILPHGPFDIGTSSDLPGSGTLLVFGSLRRNKRVLEAIKAVQLCRRRGKQVSLLIAGAPDRQDPDYWAQCAEQIATAPDSIRTEIGFVPDERIPALIEQTDAVLLPYRDFSSASGVAILMATSQRPLIATATGGIKDLFAMGMAGIPLEEGADTETIAEAIDRFVEEPPSTWRAKASAARSKLLETLSWKTIGQGYLDVMAAR